MALNSMTYAYLDFDFDIQNSLNFLSIHFFKSPSDLCCELIWGLCESPTAAIGVGHWNSFYFSLLMAPPVEDSQYNYTRNFPGP